MPPYNKEYTDLLQQSINEVKTDMTAVKDAMGEVKTDIALIKASSDHTLRLIEAITKEYQAHKDDINERFKAQDHKIEAQNVKLETQKEKLAALESKQLSWKSYGAGVVGTCIVLYAILKLAIGK